MTTWPPSSKPTICPSCWVVPPSTVFTWNSGRTRFGVAPMEYPPINLGRLMSGQRAKYAPSGLYLPERAAGLLGLQRHTAGQKRQRLLERGLWRPGGQRLVLLCRDRRRLTLPERLRPAPTQPPV